MVDSTEVWPAAIDSIPVEAKKVVKSIIKICATLPDDVVTYVVQLQDNNWYVGKTSKLDRRLCYHFCSHPRAAVWTQKHAPLAVYDIFPGDLEEYLTIKMMHERSPERVRGACWTSKSFRSMFGSQRGINKIQRISSELGFGELPLDLDRVWA